MTNDNNEYNYVCPDCGSDRGGDGFMWGACDGCGATRVIPYRLYDDEDGRQPAPAEHAPRKEALLSSEGEFVVAEVENTEAWVCVDTRESGPNAVLEVTR